MPAALVGDRDGDVDPLARGAHADGRVGGRGAGRVGEQVAQHLHNARAVGYDLREVGRQLQLDWRGTPPAPAKRLRASSASCRSVGGLGGDGERARLDAGHVEQVTDQIAHLVRLVADDAQELGRLGGVERARGPRAGS